ncbi:MAG: NAD-dependent epimerase/dehydratase family protein [bacterium]
MFRKRLKDAIARYDASVKEVMRLIDYSGLRVAYIVDEQKRLVGAVSDSEIRKAILKGKDIKSCVKDIVNPDPIVLRERDLSVPGMVKRSIVRLLERMPDSRHILVLDSKNRPIKIAPISKLAVLQSSEAKVSPKNNKHILVVGGAGYLGSVLVRKLLANGFKVRVLDILMFGKEPIEELLNNDNFELIEGDMRNISTLTQALIDIDAVINLAAIVGDPACKTKPEATIETNYLANKVLAEACKYHQINRFIYASTCSVYGQMKGNEELTEDSPLNPVSLYARSKIQSEEGILSLEDENFSLTIMRMSTLYGFSPRMRFDLVVNTMTKDAVVNGKILVHGGGKQWRPLLNVEDAAEAYIRCLLAPLAKIKGQVFNVGSSQQNYRIIDIAKEVKHYYPEANLVIEGESTDPRNYFVSFAKIEKELGYKVKKGLGEEIKKIGNAIKTGHIKDVNDPKYYNLEYNQ